MKSQYRVIWKREGNRPKHKLFAGMPSAERYVGLLTSPEPWKFLRDFKRKGPDDYYCCPGTREDECGCRGITVRDWCEEQRKDLPRIEWVRIERRDVGPWAEPVAEGGGRVPECPAVTCLSPLYCRVNGCKQSQGHSE